MDKLCPFCGGSAKLHTRQLRFIGQNALGDKKVRLGAQYVCGQCHARGPLYTADVINPHRKTGEAYDWITRQAQTAWNWREP